MQIINTIHSTIVNSSKVVFLLILNSFRYTICKGMREVAYRAKVQENYG